MPPNVDRLPLDFFLLLLLRLISFQLAEAILPGNQAQQPEESMATNDQQHFAQKLRVPAQQWDKVKNLHENLYYGGLKALLGQLGKQHFRKVGEAEKRRLANCLDRVDNRFDLVSPAKCLVESRLRHLEWEELMHEAEREEAKGQQAEMMGADGSSSRGRRQRKMPAFAQEEEEVETGRQKQEEKPFIKKRRKAVGRRPTNWRLSKFGRKTGKMPLDRQLSGHGHALLSQILIPAKAKTRFYKYRARRRRMRREIGDGMDIDEIRKVRLEMEESQKQPKESFKIRSTDADAPLASRDEKSLGSRISNLLLKAIGPKAQNANIRWGKAQHTLERLAEQIERSKKFPGTRVFEKRMYDIVLDREEPSLSRADRRSPLALIQQAAKLIDLIPAGGRAKNDSSAAQPQNVRLFSPRFMPLAPDKGGPAHQSSLMSPTLLAMYEESDNRSVANVPAMLRTAGVSEKDRQGIIATMMELTGTTEHVENALGLLKKADFFNEDVGHPLMKATERLLNAFFSLEDSLDGQQRRQFRERGFTFGSQAQLTKLLRDQAVDEDQLPAEELARFARYDRMSMEEKELALWVTVEQLANGGFGGGNNSIGTHRRVKRTFPTQLFNSIVLSPFQFAPMFGLIVFGPVILSPSTFSPYILAPSIFSPLILSPLVFSPLVLSPSVASPWILTPGVANPYIISPYIFGPFILGPLVLHPFVISPYALSPNILNPYVLSPIVLNPILLSPDILSPQVLGGAVLSPAMLSPAILTQTFLMVSIFSPTFLS